MSDIKWIFSGVGIAIIAGIIALIKWLIKRRRAQEPSLKEASVQEPSLKEASVQDIIDAPPPPKQELVIKATSLSPKKIMDEIKAAPLLQQPDICKQYEGIKVSWKGNLRRAEKVAKDNLKIMAVVHDEMNDIKGHEFICVFFNVNPKQYAGIGLLRDGHEILVEGKIDRVSSNEIITLDLENLVFNIDNSD